MALAQGLSDDQRHHLHRVLRLKDGDAVIVTDGAGSLRHCRLVDSGLEPEGDVDTVGRPSPQVGVVQAVPAARKLDEITRMVAEVGAAWLQPVITSASSPFARDAAGAERRQRRLEAIAVSAMEQSRSRWLLEVRQPMALADATTSMGDAVVVALDPVADRSLREVADDASTYAVVVGPESGWSMDERSLLGSARVRLGSEILRTEHAAMAAVSAILARGGRW